MRKLRGGSWEGHLANIVLDGRPAQVGPFAVTVLGWSVARCMATWG